MSHIKNAVRGFIMIALIAFWSLMSARVSHCNNISDMSAFRDLNASIEELRLKVEKVSPAVVMIVVYDITGAEIRRRSGFFIDREGLIITNEGAIKDAYSAEVYSEYNHYDNVAIIKRDKDADLALIRVKAIDESPLELDLGYEAKYGERVVIIGKSPNSGKTVSEGLISSTGVIGEYPELIQIQVTSPILSFKASKDGPVLNMSEKIIGITTTEISQNQDTDFILYHDDQNRNAVTISSIEAFLSKPEKIEHLHPPGSKVFFKWFVARLKTAAINTFIILYTMGFPKIMAIIFVIVLVISFIQWLYIRLRKIM